MFSQVREDFESWEKRRIGGLRANKSTVARHPWLAGFAVVQWAWPIGQDGSTWGNRLPGHFSNSQYITFTNNTGEQVRRSSERISVLTSDARSCNLFKHTNKYD